MSNKDLSVSLEIAFLFCRECRGSLINKTKYHKGKQAETEGSASFLRDCILLCYVLISDGFPLKLRAWGKRRRV